MSDQDANSMTSSKSRFIAVVSAAALLSSGLAAAAFMLQPSTAQGGPATDAGSSTAAAGGRPLSTEDVDAVINALGAMLSKVRPSAAESATAVVAREEHTAGRSSDAQEPVASIRAESDGNDKESTDYAYYLSSSADDGQTKCDAAEEMGAVTCDSTTTARGTLLDVVYVHTAFDLRNQIYTLLETAPTEADLPNLRVQHAVTLYSVEGVVVSAEESVYGPSSLNFVEDFNLTTDEMVQAVSDDEGIRNVIG